LSDRTYHVYVVELRPELCAAQGCPSRNELAPIYVGESFHTPEDRLQQHLDGHKSSRHVRKYGVRLLPKLCEGIGPFATRAEAVKAEADLAKRLRAEGYCVFGGH
jgi:hypothetical protein